ELFNAGTTHAKYRVHYQKTLVKIANLKVTGSSPLGALHGAGMAAGFEIAVKIAEEAFDRNPECLPEEPSDPNSNAQCSERGPFRCQRAHGHPGRHEAHDPGTDITNCWGPLPEKATEPPSQLPKPRVEIP